MMTKIKGINRFFLLLTGPFLGLLIAMLISGPGLDWQGEYDSLAPNSAFTTMTNQIASSLDHAMLNAEATAASIQESTELYHKTTATMSSILDTAKSTASRPETIYNRRITSKLGAPFETVQSDNIRMELYRINPGTYTGYALKIKLKTPDAMKMTLGKDKWGGSETTLQAAKRYGAIAGINAGGFADSKGSRYPLSTTVLNGKYLNGFEASFKDLFFVGMNSKGKLIGGKFNSQSDLDKLKPVFGASFVPILLQDGVRTSIPLKWQVSPLRAPRTVIGNYKDDQLIVLVIDGYDEKGGSGATLAELQNKLFHMGVQDAYNLDGGGSSSLVFNGKVVNSPSDGELRPVPTHFLFFK